MTNPYRELPFYTRWSKVVAGTPIGSVDPAVGSTFNVDKANRIATGGSCFAQHIARHLKRIGYNYFVVEEGHPLGTEEDKIHFGYGTFSARYGNIYTPKQLLQLLMRCIGEMHPTEASWLLPSGGFADPFRPAIQPAGFCSEEEMIADRVQHLAAVKKLFTDADIFIFTLGLTEAWRSRDDGSVFPVCPGVHAGEFSHEKYEFVNFDVFELLSDMESALKIMKTLNPSIRVLLTVSPVPLIATAVDRHVLVSTVSSKSALRTCCDVLTAKYDFVEYFPSYEIITGSYTRGMYFGEDLRSVTEAGVEHVMKSFIKNVTSASAAIDARVTGKNAESDLFLERMKSIVKANCEEELIEASLR